MHLAALLIGLIACAGIVVLGVRFLLQPRQATLDFGVAADNLRALTEIKGARDIASGVVLLVVLASAGRVTFGWALIAAAITPAADALIVRTNGGKLAKALSIHGLTAALLIAAGLVLALGGARQPGAVARPVRRAPEPRGSASRRARTTVG